MPDRLIPNLRKQDTTRASRLMIAFAEGDDLALRMVLAEAAKDPHGANGLIFALAHMAVDLAEYAAPEGQTASDGLRRYLATEALEES